MVDIVDLVGSQFEFVLAYLLIYFLSAIFIYALAASGLSVGWGIATILFIDAMLPIIHIISLLDLFDFFTYY